MTDANDGLTEEIRTKIKSVFKRHAEVKKVLLYGSRAKGTFKVGSDLDLSIVGSNVTLTQLLKIENELDDLLLPYKIDLNIYHLIDNSELKDHIDRIGKTFFMAEHKYSREP